MLYRLCSSLSFKDIVTVNIEKCGITMISSCLINAQENDNMKSYKLVSKIMFHVCLCVQEFSDKTSSVLNYSNP